MKYCAKCGKELLDEAVICVGCGCAVASPPTANGRTGQITDEPKEGKKTAVVLGILGIIFAWLFAIVGHILSIIGIVNGVKEYKENNKIAGLVLSIIGEVCAILSSIIGAAAMS